ncbi:MAG: acyl carrier protein [Marinomonas colpomeniae]
MNSINQEVFEKVSGALQELFELSADDIKPSSKLYEDLDIDSIDAVDLVVELKKMTGKKINPDDFKSVRTVEDVVVAVEKLFI